MVEFFINGRFFLNDVHGIQRVAREVISSFDRLIEEKQYSDIKLTILHPKNVKVPKQFKNISVKEIGINNGLLWEQIDLPIFLRGRYCLHFAGSAPIFGKNGCLVVHDAQIRSSKDSYNLIIKLMDNITPIISKRYSDFVTVSLYSKNEIKKYNITSRSDVNIIYNGGDHVKRHIQSREILQFYGVEENQYLISNSYIHPHKNVAILFEALRPYPELCSKLVLFGSSKSEDFEKRGISIPSGVKFLGRIPDRDLITLMANARLFLFPSKTEGFGLPPLEAMTLGCPTLCSDAGAMPEICADGAAYVAPESVEGWRDQIQRLWHDEKEREGLSERARAIASQYTWDRAGRKYLEILRKAR